MEGPGDQHWLEARFAEIRPKAVAALTRQFRDLDLAEEVFSVACLKALQSWPDGGVPDDPFAWLLVAGRNAGLDIIRRNTRRAGLAVTASQPADMTEAQEDWADNAGLRDDVLRLMFICCHPDLAPQDQLAQLTANDEDVFDFSGVVTETPTTESIAWTAGTIYSTSFSNKSFFA